MAFANIVTTANGTVIRSITIPDGRNTEEVDKYANILSSIIVNDREALKIEVDYTGCHNEDVITHYEP